MDILNTLLEITIYSGIIFFITMFIKKTFKNKMSPFLHFAIWAVFLLRLVVPVTIDTPLSLFTYQPTRVITPIHASLASFEPVTQESAAVDSQPDDPMRSDSVTDAAEATVQTYTPVLTPATRPARLSLDQISLVVWLGGAVLGLFYFALLAALLARKIARRSAPASAHLNKLLDDIKAELHIKAKLQLVCQLEYGSPALLFPRTILIPMDKLAAMNDEQIKNCLRHECMHYKRGDHFMSLFLTVLNAVYWFNPFMWIVYFEMRKDMETACDGAVVKHLAPCARRDYAELILKLSGHTRHMQFVLGMANSRKNAERRIKGVFMAQKTKRSVKFISSMLALLLLLCCFTTACQPTPAKPVVANKSGGITAKMIADPLPPGAVKDVDAPQHWKESMTRLNGHMIIDVDTDVKIPENLSDTPVYKIEQAELTQQRLSELTHYFVGDSKLYKPLPMTSFEGLTQLQKIKDGTGLYGEHNFEARKHMADKLQELIDEASASTERTYTDLSFTQPYDSEYKVVIDAWLKAEGVDGILKPKGEKYVNVYAETGEEYEPTISASTYDDFAAIPSNFTFAYPGDILTADDIKQINMSHEMYNNPYYTIEETLQNYLATANQHFSELGNVINSVSEEPEQALSAAQKALDDLGIVDVSLDNIQKGVWLPRQPQEWDELSTPTSKAQGGYSIVFSRSADQLAGFRANYNGMNAKEMLTYTPPFLVEQISMFISDGKILQFDWRSMSQAIETVAANTNLLSFEEIKERLADYLSYNFSYTGPDNESFSIDIVDAQLRSSQITAKDDPFRAWLVPSWVFKIRLDYDESHNTSTIISADYPCEINALDGGIITPESN